MRPHTLLNVATSIDGKVTTQARDLHAFGGDEDQELMEELRTSVDAVMIGAGTVRDEDPLLTVRSRQNIERRRRENRSDQPHAIVVSASLDFPLKTSRFFASAGVRKFVCTANDAPLARINFIRRYAEVIQAPRLNPAALDLAAISSQLATVGIKRLLLEGGGTLNFAMIAAGLVDEIYLTICPMVIGGSRAPTSFDGIGFGRETIRALQLFSVRQGKYGRVFLRYTS